MELDQLLNSGQAIKTSTGVGGSNTDFFSILIKIDKRLKILPINVGSI